ncbi:hypothetical protein UREG_05468 [Uncinocarpus reesii 1704]|uniref:alpha-1,2-Mannosidase n=1 Tax=Uncinocarpus reesii (strain UAMH 1704) TaxID=336963 RepID=C4JSM9_UNCRE|nr:uncharacterized protein UREG_05468 [Uncinocarpus reesii 1704]EEP80626.1 hypothetical protein UREG_05468 [Uncinocarpus reesii 1704]
MPRLRRYRVFLVFAVVSIIAFIRFTGIREWRPPNQNYHPTAEQKAPAPPAAPPPQPPDRKATAQRQPTSPVKAKSTPTASSEKAAAKPPAIPPAKSPAPTTPAVVAPLPGTDIEFGPGGQGRLEVPGLDRSSVRWQKQREHFPVPTSSVIKLPKGKPKNIPQIQFKFPSESPSTRTIRAKRLALIKASFKRSWNGYKAHAWGRDELKPVYGGARDPFMGWGATLVDGLDTLWIMDMRKEFAEAVKAVERIDFKTSHRKDIPLFETVIRYLGGLLGAYDISEGRFPTLVDKATELAEILIGAFDTPNRMPLTYYMWAPTYASQPHRGSTRVVLAELGSLSMEFTRLAQLTGENKYYDAIARITNELEKFQPNTTLPGLWPSHIDVSGCQKAVTPASGIEESDGSVKMPPVIPKPNVPPKAIYKRQEAAPKAVQDTQPAVYDSQPKPAQNVDPRGLDATDCAEQGLRSPPFSRVDRYTLGALADSTYEYLPKMHLLIGGLSDQYRNMYKMAMDTVRNYMLFRPMLPDNRDVLFHAGITSSGPPEKKSDLSYEYEGHHLGCFAGGMFALGAKLFGIDGDMDLAAKLTEGCVWAYNATKTGVMPESFEVLPCDDPAHCEWNVTRYYDKLDPYEEERKLRVQTWLEQKAELEKAEKAAKDKERMAPVAEATAELPIATGPIILTKRHNAMPDDPSRIDGMDNPFPDFLGPKPTFSPHKEYAEQRLKEERIPFGMTDIMSRKYILRPEAIESVFYMYRTTGDESWREKGWAMFQAVELATRTELGSSAIKDVMSDVPMPLNEMESFWLGETLKYFYLLFSDPEEISLDEYVFNTEAHPFKLPLNYKPS